MENLKFRKGSVKSIDGAEIGYYSLGSGPGLVVVHGSLRSAADYEVLGESLADTFTVHIVNRRGRGNSGPQGNDYSFEKEVADVTAVLKETGSSLLFGHSYGGTVALEVALNNYPLQKLAVYEPAISIENSIPINTLPKIEQALNSKDYKKAFAGIMNVVSNGTIPENQLPDFALAMSRYPIWPYICSLLETAPAEIIAVHNADNSYLKYSAIKIPTLFLNGSKSPPQLAMQTAMFAGELPNSKIIQIEGARHSGPDIDAPLEIANELKGGFRH
ncbi:alpha/beta hydrolase [Mucilaginibacter sp.]|uniref:alpha/beta fold hydrolase n=1 Tax=Mucilaginibacter sp. TaxID=1882438 RepID=UPI0025CFBDAE|nr:alpha/beta hydrolase [Mucilaginibacter sp.]